ncbi:MAG: hypothetical protein H6538_07235 [Bacteroidales bacterium]|nr:hypothetical protein [Bacteroidales bacterium]MCB8999221.1 hypothetical protein [Bacteroidales bacterium]
MTYNLIPASEIEKSKLNEQIIRETAMQVLKDFASFGIDVSFPEDIKYAYESLYDQLKIIIAVLLEKEPERLASLLYHIDLDERKMKKEPALFTEHEFISQMILEREFLKVLTRNYFKTNPGIFNEKLKGASE